MCVFVCVCVCLCVCVCARARACVYVCVYESGTFLFELWQLLRAVHFLFALWQLPCTRARAFLEFVHMCGAMRFARVPERVLSGSFGQVRFGL